MKQQNLEFRGNIVDVVGERIFKGIVIVRDSKIAAVREEDNEENVYILPGLIDAHIHIESSMLVPSEFARLAVVHGTIGTVSDPHEIANVLGVKGVRFMIENGKRYPLNFILVHLPVFRPPALRQQVAAWALRSWMNC